MIDSHRLPRYADPLPLRPRKNEAYAFSSRAEAESWLARHSHEGATQVVEDIWDPMDGDGPRQQWIVV